jgi:agmatinase
MKNNFLGLEEKYSDYNFAKYCVLPIPYEKTTSYGKGTQFGPKAIIEASQQVELYDEELDREPYLSGIYTSNELHFESEKDTTDSLNSIFKAIKTPLYDEKIVFSLGGEHSITSPLVCAYIEKYPKLSILQFDAHADLRQSYMDSMDNHACVMARVNEIAKVIGIGIRALSREEADRIKSENLSVFFAHKMQSNKVWKKEVLDLLTGPVYISFDVDYFDPSIMPSTGTPEPGGFLWRETLDFLKQVFHEKEVVGCDVVELAPQPGASAPDFMIARLVYKMIGFHGLANEF